MLLPVSVRSISCICSGVSDATSAARAAVDIFGGWPGIDAGFWKADGTSWLNDDPDGREGPAAGIGGVASTSIGGVEDGGGVVNLPLLRTQIPIRYAIPRLVGKSNSSSSSRKSGIRSEANKGTI